jgi:hypothetical protein
MRKNDIYDHIYAHPIPLICFLEQLYSKDHFTSILEIIKVKSEALLRSFVYFTHFIKIKNKIMKEDLVKYLQRGVAIICETGETEFDIYIPLVISKEGINLDIFKSESYTISCFFDQVKNWDQNININDIVEKMFKNDLFMEFKEEGTLCSTLFLLHNVANHHLTSNSNKDLPYMLHSSELIADKVNEKNLRKVEKKLKKNAERVPVAQNTMNSNFSKKKKTEKKIQDEEKESKFPIELMLPSTNQQAVSEDMLVLLLFGVGDYSDFNIPCLAEPAIEVLKQMRLVQQPFEAFLALHNLYNKNKMTPARRKELIGRKKKMMIFEFSPNL